MQLSYSCRNCDSKKITKIPSGAIVAPLFAARVAGFSNVQLDYRNPKVKLLNFLTFGFAGKVAKKSKNWMDSLIFESCGFFSTWREIPDAALSNLYFDYRGDTYNSERDYYEPGYLKYIAPMNGGEDDAKLRNNALQIYLDDFFTTSNINSDKICCALAWGGADGRFMPQLGLNTKRSVFEISNIEPIAGVTRISTLNKDIMFDYIQVAHVLEHISNPLRFINEVVTHLNYYGFLYLEVPSEVESSKIVEDVKFNGLILEVHEHINKYTSNSLSSLAKAANLEVLDVRTEIVKLSWCNSKVIRLLAQKMESNSLTFASDN